MHSTKSIGSTGDINASPLPTPKRPQLEEAPTGVSAGREVAVHEKNKPSFLNLPYIAQSMIIRCLSFREITALAKVCKHLHELVKNDKTLEKAWYRRFPSPHQYQLKTIFTAKDNQQLSDWLRSFANADTA
ncbi:F-box protein, partial [Endozoicomonas sp. SESOKO2]|uniref:F-box protein n=1 Tax=Endozoicomonas sp. SESOKO2 TaxID=2828743 RepID=UPI0021491F4E